MYAAFSREQDENQTEFGKMFTNLSLKFVVLIVGEIEQRIFCAMVTFCLAKKFDEIDPRNLFQSLSKHNY